MRKTGGKKPADPVRRSNQPIDFQRLAKQAATPPTSGSRKSFAQRFFRLNFGRIRA